MTRRADYSGRAVAFEAMAGRYLEAGRDSHYLAMAARAEREAARLHKLAADQAEREAGRLEQRSRRCASRRRA